MTVSETDKDKHKCGPPPMCMSPTIPIQPDWTCGVCGRVWRDCRTANGVQWWAEVRGPDRA